MIRVHALIADNSIDFHFDPEPRFWVLHGTSIARIQQDILAEIHDELALVTDQRMTPRTRERITEAAQRVIDSLVVQGRISA